MKDTDELNKALQKITHKNNLYSVLDDIASEKISLTDYIQEITEKKEIAKSFLVQASGLDRTYAYQILNGTKKPGRNKLLALCLGGKFDLKETQRALALAELGKLYAKKKRDAILIYALENKLTLQQTNELLHEFHEAIIE